MEQPGKAFLLITYHDLTTEVIDVQYNPTDLSLDKSVQIAEIAIPGLDAPLQQFVRGQAEKLTMDLFFDTTEKGMGEGASSVTTLTDRFYELVKIEPSGHAPPICTFMWNNKFPGSDISPHAGNQKRTDFQCIIEGIKQKFTLFSSEGVPLRATLTLTLREYKTLDEQLHQLNLSSPDRTHRHIVQRGETLSGIAARYYRKPGGWRHVAEDNNVEDPRRIEVGMFLTIPPVQ